MNLSSAAAIAAEIRDALLPVCDQCEIAGSIRRGKYDVGDIELVLQLKEAESMFGDAEPDEAALAAVLTQLAVSGVAKMHTEKPANGPKMKRLKHCATGAQVELWIAQKDNFGCIYVIRTGDKEFTNKLVTARKFQGLMPGDMRQEEGYLWRFDPQDGGEIKINCHTEAAYFAALGYPVPEPRLRTIALIPVLWRQWNKEISL